MKKMIALLLALVMCLSLCACGSGGNSGAADNSEPSSSPEEPKVEYKKYTVGGLSFELPAGLSVKQEEKSLSVEFDQTNFLTASSVYDKMSGEDEFKYYCETFYVNSLSSNHAKNIQFEKTTIKAHSAYKYTAQVQIAGNAVAVDCVVLLLGSEVISIMMTHSGSEYTDIYTHLLNSIQ